MDPGINHRPHGLHTASASKNLKKRCGGFAGKSFDGFQPKRRHKRRVSSCSGLGSFIRVNESDVIDHQRVV